MTVASSWTPHVPTAACIACIAISFCGFASTSVCPDRGRLPSNRAKRKASGVKKSGTYVRSALPMPPDSSSNLPAHAKVSKMVESK